MFVAEKIKIGSGDYFFLYNRANFHFIMAKVIRSTYPLEFSVGLLLLIFVLSSFLSSQVFQVSWRELMDGSNVIFGMFLVGVAVVIMALILWEEFLFPVHIKPTEDEVVFKNHATKLKTQIVIYCVIPIIFGFIYFNYEVNHVRFFIWAAICIVTPVAGKLISGIKNYNDFLKLTDDTIEYKNNEEEGVIHVKDIKQIILIEDESKVLHKIQLHVGDKEITIDLDEMELEAYYVTIEEYMAIHYSSLPTKTVSSSQS
jgi:hypothetical protein